MVSQSRSQKPKLNASLWSISTQQSPLDNLTRKTNKEEKKRMKHYLLINS